MNFIYNEQQYESHRKNLGILLFEKRLHMCVDHHNQGNSRILRVFVNNSKTIKTKLYYHNKTTQ